MGQRGRACARARSCAWARNSRSHAVVILLHAARTYVGIKRSRPHAPTPSQRRTTIQLRGVLKTAQPPVLRPTRWRAVRFGPRRVFPFASSPHVPAASSPRARGDPQSTTLVLGGEAGAVRRRACAARPHRAGAPFGGRTSFHGYFLPETAPAPARGESASRGSTESSFFACGHTNGITVAP